MDKDVVHCLQVEALLDLGERRVEEVGQCHEVHEQAHDRNLCDVTAIEVGFVLNSCCFHSLCNWGHLG